MLYYMLLSLYHLSSFYHYYMRLSLLYAFINQLFKCIDLFRNIDLPSLAQSVERWIRYFYIIRNRQYIALYYQIMSLKILNYLLDNSVIFYFKFKNKK